MKIQSNVKILQFICDLNKISWRNHYCWIRNAHCCCKKCAPYNSLQVRCVLPKCCQCCPLILGSNLQMIKSAMLIYQAITEPDSPDV